MVTFGWAIQKFETSEPDRKNKGWLGLANGNPEKELKRQKLYWSTFSKSTFLDHSFPPRHYIFTCFDFPRGLAAIFSIKHLSHVRRMIVFKGFIVFCELLEHVSEKFKISRGTFLTFCTVDVSIGTTNNQIFLEIEPIVPDCCNMLYFSK